jgi:hypothetical protein
MMNIIQKTKQQTTIPPLLLFSISLFLLSNSFMAAALPYTIGDTGPGQGIVFFISADGKHGLEAATSDLGRGIHWFNGSYNKVTNAVRNGVNAGLYNTERIIINQGAGNYAAQLCANYRGGGYGDWYLPSKRELNLLYGQKAVVGGFTSSPYWSSTEYSGYYAWTQRFDDGYQDYDDKYLALRVRAVRAF